VEVLSGFINGIFLIFIAFAILLESVERYYHPQDINTDKLLLVSCLGLAVNLVGVVAFHDLHGGGGDHGHSHSHGHSHGHDHGHGHKEGKPEKKVVNENIFGLFTLLCC
jgi:zinc transporter 5/7